MKTAQTKKTVFSGIQPSGVPTLGNYLGALNNWVNMQDDFDCIYSIVDMHAITVRQDPKELNRNTLGTYALLMACGIDPKKSVLFIQSHVRAHAELAWILNTFTQFGELSRMTQFKDKSITHSENINAGLFTYPSLMAADILLYDTHFVPVGGDQKQHLELTRDIAVRMNGIYGDIVTVPEPFIPKEGSRIMSLQVPEKKMSKSDSNPNGYVSILDPKDTIIKKFRRSITDSETVVRYAEHKTGINNLMTIYSVITGKQYGEIEKEFDGKGYGDFKNAVGEAVADRLEPIRTRYNQLMDDRALLEECYKNGAAQALERSLPVLNRIKERIGYVL